MSSLFENHRLWLNALCACCLAAPAFACAAQAGEERYPTKPIRFIVPQPPSGTADILARMIGQKLPEVMLREMDAAGVDRAVIAPPVWEGVRNDYALAAAQRHPDRFAVMGRVDLNNPASRELIPTWREQPGMLGFRYAFHRPLIRPLLVEGRVDWLFAESDKAGCPIMLFARQSDLHLIKSIAERHHVHRGDAMAPGRRPELDHGARAVRVDRMENVAAREQEWMNARDIPLKIGSDRARHPGRRKQA